MIIESIINYLELSLKAAMQEVLFHGICERLETTDGGEKTKTIGKYDSAGEFVPINYDGAKAQVYFRYDGAIASEELDEEEYSCDVTEEMTIPFKVVFIANKSYRADDTAFTSHNLAMALKKALTATNPAGVLAATKIDYFTSRVRDTDFDFQSIAEDEGFKVDYNSTLIALRLDVVIRGRQGCLEDCDTAGSICLPATIRNSDNSFSIQAPCGETTELDDIAVKREDGTTLRTEPAAIDITIQDAIVRNTDSSYLSSVAAEGTHIIPDITLTDVFGNAVTKVAAVNIAATQYGDITAQQHEDNLSIIKRNQLSRLKRGKTGQTSPYESEDDGDLEFGRGASWSLLDAGIVNDFNNQNRFTDILGGQNYAANGNLLIDWQENLMWYLTFVSFNENWATAMATVRGFSTGGFSDWIMPNRGQLFNVVNHESVASAPFSFNTTGLSYWTSTSVNLTIAYRMRIQGGVANFDSLVKTSTTDTRVLVCRVYS